MTDYADLRKRLDEYATAWEKLTAAVMEPSPFHMVITLADEDGTMREAARIAPSNLREASAAIAALVRERDDLKRDVLEIATTTPLVPPEGDWSPLSGNERVVGEWMRDSIVAALHARLSPPPSVEGSKDDGKDT